MANTPSQTEPAKIILLEESLWNSVKRDAFSVISAFALILPGWFLGSSAMQWVGFLALMVVVAKRSAGLRNEHSMTVSEAREFLDALSEQERE